MKMRYQWSEDGEVELCECEKITVREETSCYQCDLAIQANETAVKLTAPDGDVYILHIGCADQNCKA